MDFRYLGFDQSQNARAYRFDVTAKGEGTRHFVVTVDVALFHAHNIGIQEGPSLCMQKLTTELEGAPGGDHQLTGEDLRLYAATRAAEAARKAEARKPSTRRSKNHLVHSQSPWRGAQR